MKANASNPSAQSKVSTTIWRASAISARTTVILALALLLPASPVLAADLVLIGTHPTSPLTAQPTIHTMKAFEGRIYFGYGEWQGANFPAVVVTSYDPVSNAFHLEFSANTDSIGLFREIGGKLYFPSIDPTLYAESADYSYRAGGVWRDSAPAGMLHVFEVATLDGSDLWFVGSKTANETAASGPAVFRSADGGRTSQDLTVQSALTGDDGRYYWGFPLRGRFYVRDAYYEGTNGTRTAVATYRHFNRATLMRDGTNDFVVGVTGWVSGTGGPVTRLLVTFDGQTWRTIRPGNIVYHFTVSGSNIYTLETNALANANHLWKASAVTPSQAVWERLDFNNVPPNAKAIEVLNGVVYVADTQGRLWAGRLDGGAFNGSPPSGINELPDDFGRALSFDGERLAVGAPDHSDAVPLCGQVSIWEQDGAMGTSHATSLWRRTATIDPPAPSFSGWFGKYLILKENVLAVVEAGRDLSGRDRGSSAQVHLYERVGQAWAWRRSLNHPYAQSVALDSGWLAVGVGGTGNGINALFLYSVGGSNNGLEGTLRTNFVVQPHITLGAENFWRPTARVALESNVCVFATVGDSGFFGGPGEVQIYQRDEAGVWALQQVLQSPSPTPAGPDLPPDRFGFSLALQNGWLAVGAPRDDTSALQAGAVHLYERTNGSGASFVLRQSLYSPLTQPDAAFGTSVALNSSTLLVGCPGAERNTERHHGAVFVFRREQSGWENVAEITRPSESTGEFGNTVAFGSNWLAASSRFSAHSNNVADRVTLWPFGPPGGELFVAAQTNAAVFELTARGEIGRAYDLQATMELPSAAWTNLFRFRLKTVVTNLVDPNAASVPRRFYRLAAP